VEPVSKSGRRAEVTIRELTRDEIERVWEIDRREVIENVYSLRDGLLVLEPEHHDMEGWPRGEAEIYTPIFRNCFDRGGTFLGAFEESKLVGAAVLESRFIGRNGDQLQLKFLHVSHDERNKGLGKALFQMAVARARDLGAKRLYISATPSQNTVDFYLRLGCEVTAEFDRELFDLEPDDIHLEYEIPRDA
jgi:predicted N-acetyltransferase YhbS